MTPSSNEGAPGVIRRSLRSPIGDDDSNAGSVLSSQGDLASQSNNDQALSEDESMSNSSYESDIELSDDDEVSEKPNSASFPEAQKLAEVDAIKYTKETSCPGPDDKESHPIKAPVKSTELPPNNSMGNDITGLPGLRHSGIGVNPRDILEPEVGMAETYRQIVNSGWPSTFYGSYNSFDPLLGRAKPFDHSLTGFHSNKQSQENEEWRTSQGISNSSCIPMTNGHSRGSFLDEVCRPCVSYNDGPFVNAMLPRNVARDGTSSGHGMGINGATPATTENSAIPDYSASEERNIHPRPDTRLRIADIVSYPPPALQRSQRKRKAADMDNDQLLDDNNAAQNAYKFNPTSFKENKCVGSDNDDTCLPDAQPQAGVETMEDSYSQPTALSAANESQTVETKSHSSTENERQVKRQKKYDTVTVGSHATTAVLGAVIGAVGTVALLASLPSDYFL
ncbi:hypothetical protein EYZ11_002163 [Aspergillus tanneri]|nr:hypothetical protein EYZ11_002163 [Aspergillus tanneri]